MDGILKLYTYSVWKKCPGSDDFDMELEMKAVKYTGVVVDGGLESAPCDAKSY